MLRPGNGISVGFVVPRARNTRWSSWMVAVRDGDGGPEVLVWMPVTEILDILEESEG